MSAMPWISKTAPVRQCLICGNATPERVYPGKGKLQRVTCSRQCRSERARNIIEKTNAKRYR